MLSPNTLLNKARYRVDRLHLAGTVWNVYAALDRSVDAAVLVVEHQSEPADFPRHEGLLRFQDSFLMNGRRYDVTEPVILDPRPISVIKAWDQFSIFLMGMNTISAVTSVRCEICPHTVVANAKGVHKLLPLTSNGRPVEIESWHVPIELVWNDLDSVSQRAIYNAWDEASVDDVERPLDESSDLYSAAAIFYRVITGTPPPSAFERTVVELDGDDPLQPPQTLRPELGDEAGSHLLRCLELRRSRRFESFEAAIMSLPSLSPPETKLDVEPELDVLELGGPAREHIRSQEIVVGTAKAPPAVIADKESVELSLPASVGFETPLQNTVDETYVAVPSFGLEASKGRGAGVRFAVAGAVLAICGGIGWAAYQFAGSTPAAPPTGVSAEVLSAAPHQDPIAAPTQIPSEAPANQPLAQSAETSTIPASATVKVDTPRPRPQTAAKADPKPAAAEPKPKKKVTVDDLINDN